MSQAPKLADRFAVRRRFFRSVELEKDTQNQVALDGYILTPLGDATLRRILSGLRPDSTSRAWTLTGPYGAGKSAFALYLAQLLGPSEERGTKAALQIARRLSEDLDKQVRSVRYRGAAGFLRVLVGGARSDLLPALVSGLETAMGQFFGSDIPKERTRSLKELQRTEGGVDAGRAYCNLLQAVSQDVIARGGKGVVLILDEMGKFLEHLANNGAGKGDIFVLQQLGEQAARSGDAPILVLTMLHQAFSRYALRLPAAARDEWSKVQGRFEDIAFLDSADQLLFLISESIDRSESVAPLSFRAFEKATDKALGYKLARTALRDALRRTAPLHPSTALVLPSVFRQTLAQHERSLFGFLTSEHPGGFSTFLNEMPFDEANPAFYRLDHLYDFLISTLGSALFISGNGKRWAEIEQGINRITSDLPPLATRLLKTVGMLTLFGQKELRAERDILCFALEDHDNSSAAIGEMVDELEKRSIIRYRKYNQAYSLWEGSDVDLDKHFEDARSFVDRGNITSRLRELLTLDPKVARRHFIETGTLRYFDMELVRPEEMESRGAAPLEEADGRILCVLPEEDDSLEEVAERAKALTEADKRLIVCLPKNPTLIQDAAITWCAWTHVRETATELGGDAVARRELAASINAAATDLDRELQSAFGLGTSEASATVWIHGGVETEWGSPRAITKALSDICGEVYSDAPRIQNELLNRRSLSSSAAAARKLLLLAMVNKGHEERLGLEGAPPEFSMYASLLQQGGLHRKRGDKWGFGAPPDKDPLRLRPMWKRIQSFLKKTEANRRPITDLYRELGEAPLGIKEGVMPVVFMAAVLDADGEIAIFEDGTYIPELTDATLERFLRRPATFEVARYAVNGARTKLVEQLAELLLIDPEQKPKPVTLVRELYQRAAKWPLYTRATRRLGENALAVRNAMLNAKDPLHLLFVDLPQAVGVKLAFESESEPLFVDLSGPLRVALAEINSAYEKLLQDVEHLMIKVLGLGGEGAVLREELTKRAKAVKKFVTDVKLQSFVLRAADETLVQQAWLESIATLAAGKPPMNWQDVDAERCETALYELGRLFVRAEELAFDAHGIGDGGEVVDLLRVSVAKYGAPEQRRLVRVHPMDETRATEAEHTIVGLLAGMFVDRPELQLAVLGRTSQHVMEEMEGHRPQLAAKRSRAKERR